MLPLNHFCSWRDIYLLSMSQMKFKGKICLHKYWSSWYFNSPMQMFLTLEYKETVKRWLWFVLFQKLQYSWINNHCLQMPTHSLKLMRFICINMLSLSPERIKLLCSNVKSLIALCKCNLPYKYITKIMQKNIVHLKKQTFIWFQQWNTVEHIPTSES